MSTKIFNVSFLYITFSYLADIFIQSIYTNEDNRSNQNHQKSNNM